MITFRCPNCDTTYRYPDARAGDKFACGKCNQRLQVPAPPAPAPGTVMGVVPGAVPPPPAKRPIALEPQLPPRKGKPAGLPTGAVGPRKWYYEYRGEAVGPVTDKDLRAAAENDTLEPDARVWTDGMDDWQPARAAAPRVFDGLEVEPARWGGQKRAAVVMAAVAALSVLALGVVAVTRKKADANKPVEVAKTDPPPAEDRRPDPPPEPKVDRPPVAPPKDKDPAPPAAGPLGAAQILKQFGPSVAFVQADRGSGSGFLVTDNLVVTNAHVVEKALSTGLRVAFPSGPAPDELVPAALVYEDASRDLAVLEVKTALPALRLAVAAAPGEDVVVIGSPGTAPGVVAKNSVTKGVLSGVDDKTFGQRFFVIDAAINPGNSGGPAFNAAGEVIGVVTQFIPGKQSLNYIVPFEDVVKAVAKARATGGAELAALAKRHDAKAVAVRLLAAVLLNDTIQGRYVSAMEAAVGAKRNHVPGVAAVKAAWLKEVQARVGPLVPPGVLAAADRLSGTGPGGADDLAVRDDLRKLLKLFHESQALAANPEADTVENYKDRHRDTNRWFNELTKSLPKGLRTTEPDLAELVVGTFRSFGGEKLRPNP